MACPVFGTAGMRQRGKGRRGKRGRVGRGGGRRGREGGGVEGGRERGGGRGGGGNTIMRFPYPLFSFFFLGSVVDLQCCGVKFQV